MTDLLSVCARACVEFLFSCNYYIGVIVLGIVVVYVKVGRAYVVVVVVLLLLPVFFLLLLTCTLLLLLLLLYLLLLLEFVCRLVSCGMEHSIFHLMKIIFHILTIVGMNTFIICIHYVLFSMLSQTGTIVNISRWEFQLTKEVLDFSN